MASSGLDIRLGAEQLEIGEDRRRDFEVFGYVGMALDVVDGERGERSRRVEDGAQACWRLGVDDVVGLNATTTFDDAAAVGSKLGLLVGVRSRRRERVVRAFERFLNGPTARGVVERGGERN